MGIFGEFLGFVGEQVSEVIEDTKEKLDPDYDRYDYEAKREKYEETHTYGQILSDRTCNTLFDVAKIALDNIEFKVK